jgi:hypothetical protein
VREERALRQAVAKKETGQYCSAQEVLPGRHNLAGQIEYIAPDLIKLCDPRQGILALKWCEAFRAQAARWVASV